MFVELDHAAALRAFKSGELVTAAALLAEALVLPGANEAGQLQVYLTDTASLMVHAEVHQAPATALHLCQMHKPLQVPHCNPFNNPC